MLIVSIMVILPLIGCYTPPHPHLAIMESLNERIIKLEERQKTLETNIKRGNGDAGDAGGAGDAKILTDQQKELFIFMMEYFEQKYESSNKKRRK